MKMTLLEMVRDILNDMDSDDVNSITDTVEAMQVAQIIKSCYFEMMANRNWPHMKKLIQVEASGTLERPTHLKLPTNVKELEFFKYDKNDSSDPTKVEYREVHYRHPDQFLRITSTINSSPNTRQIIDFGGTPVIIKTNQPPSYWTSFDDTHIVCDSYESSVDDTLKKSKTQCLVYLNPEWVHMDHAIPEMPAEAFPALLAEAKSTAFISLKQMANEKAEQKAIRQQRWLSRKAWRAKGGVRYDNYGRVGKK